MRYTARKTRGRCRPLTRKDRLRRTEYNRRTHRAAKLWEKAHVKRERTDITRVASVERSAEDKAARMVMSLFGKR